jgi:hypothetical protein
VRWRPTQLSQNQSGAANRSRADRLRVPADTEKQGRQTDQRRQRTPTTPRDSQLATSGSIAALVAQPPFPNGTGSLSRLSLLDRAESGSLAESAARATLR